VRADRRRHDLHGLFLPPPGSHEKGHLFSMAHRFKKSATALHLYHLRLPAEFFLDWKVRDRVSPPLFNYRPRFFTHRRIEGRVEGALSLFLSGIDKTRSFTVREVRKRKVPLLLIPIPYGKPCPPLLMTEGKKDFPLPFLLARRQDHSREGRAIPIDERCFFSAIGDRLADSPRKRR